MLLYSCLFFAVVDCCCGFDVIYVGLIVVCRAIAYDVDVVFVAYVVVVSVHCLC